MGHFLCVFFFAQTRSEDCIHAKDTNFIFGIPQTYTCADTQICTHIDTHMYRETLTHRYRYTCMFVYIHKHTHTDMNMGNLRKLLVQIHF